MYVYIFFIYMSRLFLLVVYTGLFNVFNAAGQTRQKFHRAPLTFV